MSKARDEWVRETQMYQRIAKVSVSSTDDLRKSYDKMVADRKVRRLSRVKQKTP